jgi:hypothetical protein
MRVAVVVVVLLALAGVSGASATRSESPSAVASQFVSVMNSIAGITASDSGNCVKMAKDLNAYGTSHASEIATLEKAGKSMSNSQKVSVGMSIESTEASDIVKITKNVLACAMNPALQSALSGETSLSKAFSG